MPAKKRLAKFLKAFTLIEILTVLALIGALTVFTSVAAPQQLAKARDAKRKGDINKVAGAIEEYYEDKNCYPIALPVCGNPLREGDLTLVSNLPCDPKDKLSYVYVSEGGTCPKWFQLYGNLEYTSDSIIDRVGCRGGCGPDCQFNFGRASPNQRLNPYCEVAGSTPPPEASPIPSPTPTPPVAQYVCAPSGACEVFVDPDASGCPDIYPNDPTCQNQCVKHENTCHDDRGKLNQWGD